MKKFILGLCSLLLAFQSHSQLDPYKYRIGAGVGFTNYYGDLSPYLIEGLGDVFRLYEYNPNYIPDYSFAFSLERRLSSSVGLMLQVGQYDFSMSDRYVNRDGVLRTDLPNFERALNFRTRVQDAGLAFVFKMDNGKILNKHAFLAPYFTLGAGIMNFEVKGDLLDDWGNWYDYSSREHINNRHFESDLTSLETEVPGGYTTTTFYANLGLGLRFRIARSLELFVQSDFRLSGTDYLDDVSGPYRDSYESPFQEYAAMPGNQPATPETPFRGANNGHNDIYVFHQVGLKFSFLPSKQAFRASRVSPSSTARYEGQPISHAVLDEFESDNLMPDTLVPSEEKGNQYFTFIQINPPDQRMNALNFQMQAMQGEMGVLNKSFEKDQVQRFEERLENKQENLELETQQLLNQDSLSRNDSLRLEELDLLRQTITNQMDSVRQKKNYLEQAIALEGAQVDSLRRLAAFPTYGTRDSLAFWDELEKLPYHINQSLRQGMAGPPLPQTYGSPLSTQPYALEERASVAPAPPFASIPQREQDLPPASPYRYYPEAPYYQEFIRERPGASERQETFREEPSAYRSTPGYYRYPETQDRRNQRTSFAPIFIPRTGQRSQGTAKEPVDTSAMEMQNIAPSAVILDQDSLGKDSLDLMEITLPEISSPILDSLQNLGTLRIDTVLLEREVIVGLANSKVEVFFEINKYELSEEETEKLKPIVQILRDQPEYYVTLSGFADNTGNVNYNLQLVQRRVSHVKTLLVENFGLREERIEEKPGGLLVRGQKRGSKEEDRKVEIMLRSPHVPLQQRE
ncbi:OmpA family protein [Pleomorphovibrio marinus]|uniref:OmpA family protein n=1 Tax=Pleomorphovibrio marinus TaxID=2164132 RepID=UPI000E0A7BF5|nr:OmpA family protein [Pleomorphovibrio marinus]